MTELPPLADLLACPVDGSPLSRSAGEWVSPAGRRYQEIDGIPILFHPDADNTLPGMAASRQAVAVENDPLCLATLDVSAAHRPSLTDAVKSSREDSVDPVVSQMIAATCGNMYLGLVGALPRYPVPRFRLKNGEGKVLVDLGCNWGRWCLSAAREGFMPVGIDPQIGALLAARRVAAQLGIQAHFICADARHLPLRDNVADVVFSYSVLQHLGREDVGKTIASVGRVMKRDARMLVQMPNVAGLRCFYQWARRGFRDGSGFEVRYWTLGQLQRAFGVLGEFKFEIDCFLGIGLQSDDADLMPWKWRKLLAVSEALRKLAGVLPSLIRVADSVYVEVTKKS